MFYISQFEFTYAYSLLSSYIEMQNYTNVPHYAGRYLILHIRSKKNRWNLALYEYCHKIQCSSKNIRLRKPSDIYYKHFQLLNRLLFIPMYSIYYISNTKTSCLIV